MTRTPPPATTNPVRHWWWLVYLSMVFFQPGFDPEAGLGDWAFAVGVVAVYAPIYLIGVRGNDRTRTRLVIFTLALGVVATPFNSGASVLFVYAAAVSGALEPSTRAWRWLGASFVLLAITGVLSPVPFPYNIIAFGMPLVFIFIVGLSTMNDAERDRAARRLRVDNARIEHLATMAERDRIARDLHDVLGHTLTAVVVQSQLLQRVVETQPDRARQTAADIEAAARSALSSVRETVTGYRTTSLAEEVAEARVALAAAGVALTVGNLDVTVPPEVETALALALREGVTNVVRHAGARHCEVQVVRRNGDLVLEVIDDGHGGRTQDGNGLRGMRERINALGGQVERISGSGTRLTVAVPAEVAG